MSDVTINYPQGVTLDDVWAVLREIGKKHEELAELQKENAEEFKKSKKEFDRRRKEAEQEMKEMQKAVAETQKSVKETQKSIGGLSGAVGTMAEGLLVPNLKEKFKKLGFSFEVLSPHRKIFNSDNTIKLEIDALLENGTQAMAVETKLTCERKDIDNHLKRMEKIRDFADLHGDKRHYVGAIASPVIDEDTKRYALSNGFYVIELTGEDAQIIRPDTERVW